MMLVTAIVLSFTICFFCSVTAARRDRRDRDRLELSPVDLYLVIGEAMRINCSFCRPLRSHYNASDIAFNFTVSTKLQGSLSAEDEECNEQPDWTTEEFLETGNETGVCNTTQEEEEEENEDERLGFLDPNITTFQLSSKYIRIINRYRAELRYPLVDEQFNKGRLTCYLSPDPKILAEAHVLVGERPSMPVITDVKVRNWRRIEFSWRTIGTTKTYTTIYRAWFRNNKSEEFTECRLQPKTTPPPDFSEALGTWKRCLTFCVTNVVLSFLSDPMTSVFVLKVNASNPVGRVTSNEKIVNIYDILIPDPVLDFSVHFVDFSVCVTFRSPQRDATLDYELLFNCNSKIYESILPALKVEFFNQCISTLPSYSACVASVRAKPHGYGNWSEQSRPKEFQTPEHVPIAAPEVCHSCFEVSLSKESGNFLLKIFFKPLPHELARGRIDKYHLLVDGYNSTSMTFEPESLTLTLDNLDSSSFIYNFSLTASTTAGYNETVIPQPLTLNPVWSYGLKNTIKNVTAFIMNITTVLLSWSCLEPSDGKNFFVFWCRGEIACQGEIHSLRVPPGANQQAITIARNMEHVYFLHGVAFETKDGYSSGISWSPCLHNLSQVCLPPKLDKELIGESLRLKFHLDNICHGGYPYAFNVSYCSLEAGNESKNCKDKPVVIIVNSSDRVHEIGQLPSRDRHYLFKASCLTVAGPSLSSSEMILDPPIEPSFDARVFLVMLFAIPVVLAVVFLFYNWRRSNFPHIQIAFPEVVLAKRSRSTCDEFDDQILPYSGCTVPPSTVNTSSGHSSNGSLMRNGHAIISPTLPLLSHDHGYHKPFPSIGHDPYGPGDPEGHDCSGGNGVGDTSAGSAGSDYRAVGSLTLKLPDELMMSPPVTDLKSAEGFSLECMSVVGSESSRDQRTSGNMDSGYALGRLADRSQSGSCHSLGTNESAVQQVEVQPSLNCAVTASDKCTDGEIDNTILGETNQNDSAEDGDYDDDDGDDDDDDLYRCSSGGYATTRLRDKEIEPLLNMVASKPIMSPESGSDDDYDDSSSSCPYAAVTFCDKPVLDSSIELAEISNSS